MNRTIKSFVLRGGRVTTRQQQGLDLWLKEYELLFTNEPWNIADIFQRSADTIVEIGFGMGASLLAMAKSNPHLNYIGIEVHRAGIGGLAADLHEQQLTNVRVVNHDAVEVFKHAIADDSLTGIQIFFPDPWPKKRHHKRRLINKELIQLLVKKIKPSGFIHCATDWQEYADAMLEVFSAEPALYNQHPDGNFSPRPESRPLTKFELRGERLGHGVWDLIFNKRDKKSL